MLLILKEKIEKKHKIKYFLSSSECLDYCNIYFLLLLVSKTLVAAKEMYGHSSQSEAPNSHFRSKSPLSSPPLLHRPLQQAGLSPFLHSCSASGSGSFLTAVCVAQTLSAHQHLKQLRPG